MAGTDGGKLGGGKNGAATRKPQAKFPLAEYTALGHAFGHE
jgi:hypothetical protein